MTHFVNLKWPWGEFSDHFAILGFNVYLLIQNVWNVLVYFDKELKNLKNLKNLIVKWLRDEIF